MVLIFGSPEPPISRQMARDNRDFLAERQANTAEPPHRKNRAFRLTAGTLCSFFWGSSQTLMFVKICKNSPAIF